MKSISAKFFNSSEFLYQAPYTFTNNRKYIPIPPSGTMLTVQKADPELFCDNSLGINFAGKVALINRGLCTFNTKIDLAYAAGASGVIIVNNQASSTTTLNYSGNSPIWYGMVPMNNNLYYWNK